MNTKKQEVVEKISGQYSESKINGIIVCKNKNLTTKELTAFKRKLWGTCNVSFLKNTLFIHIIKQNMKDKDINYINNFTDNITESNLAIFSTNDNDIFEIMNKVDNTIKSLQLKKKIVPFTVLLEDKYYNSEKDMENFRSFESKEDFQAGICMMLKIIPIQLCQILQIKTKELLD